MKKIAIRDECFELSVSLPEPMMPWRNRAIPVSAISSYGAPRLKLSDSGTLEWWPRGAPSAQENPVAQIQFALGVLASWRKEPSEKLLLELALAQANNLLSKREEAGGAFWFPYSFRFEHPSHDGVNYQPPWFSGMAQGEALSLFIQLGELEQIDESMRRTFVAAAEKTFESLNISSSSKDPWAVHVDERGYLWIQEYPGKIYGTGDFTFNGMMFAMLGLWDLHRFTRDESAKRLYSQCATTISRYWEDLRNTDWLSNYCRQHAPAPSKGYHHHHIRLLHQISWQTQSSRFSFFADELFRDFPLCSLNTETQFWAGGADLYSAWAKGQPRQRKIEKEGQLSIPSEVRSPADGAQVRISGGTRVLYRFATAPDGSFDDNLADRIVEERSEFNQPPSLEPVSSCRRISGRGVFFRLDQDGPYGGMWIENRPPHVSLVGQWVVSVYRPGTKVKLKRGFIKKQLYDFDRDGTILGSVPLRRSTKILEVDCLASINGIEYFRTVSPGVEGFWIEVNATRWLNG